MKRMKSLLMLAAIAVASLSIVSCDVILGMILIAIGMVGVMVTIKRKLPFMMRRMLSVASGMVR